MYTNKNILTLTAQKSLIFNKQFVTIKENDAVCIITVYLCMEASICESFDYARFEIKIAQKNIRLGVYQLICRTIVRVLNRKTRA